MPKNKKSGSAQCGTTEHEIELKIVIKCIQYILV